MRERVVLAMSGGVDSSASAWLLKDQGFEVVGLFMRSGVEESTACELSSEELPIISSRSHKQGCCSASDAADARRVADELDIPFHALNFENAFGRIKDYFADEYLAGRTPNPCVMCNNWLKFGKLWDFARQVGATRIATGHYARVQTAETDGSPCLLRGHDLSKDQSYVLFGINREILRHVLFPVGEFAKDEIRTMSRRAGLQVADKPDSQEICFIPDNDYAGFIERYRGASETAGELVDLSGNIVGQHDGYEQFTVGQRKGLGVSFGTPRFVIRVEPETRRVVIGTRSDLACRVLEADRLNWLIPEPPDSLECQVKIRYRHEPAPALVTVTDAGLLHVEFAEPQYGVAPGQAAVVYAGEQVLGGGWIRQESGFPVA